MVTLRQVGPSYLRKLFWSIKSGQAMRGFPLLGPFSCPYTSKFLVLPPNFSLFPQEALPEDNDPHELWRVFLPRNGSMEPCFQANRAICCQVQPMVGIPASGCSALAQEAGNPIPHRMGDAYDDQRGEHVFKNYLPRFFASCPCYQVTEKCQNR